MLKHRERVVAAGLELRCAQRIEQTRAHDAAQIRAVKIGEHHNQRQTLGKLAQAHRATVRIQNTDCAGNCAPGRS